jgi:nitrate reductase NapE component
MMGWHGVFAIVLFLSTLALADFLWQTNPVRFLSHTLTLLGTILPGSRQLAAQLLVSRVQPGAVVVLSLFGMVLPILLSALWLVWGKASHRLTNRQRQIVLCVSLVGGFNLIKWIVRFDLAHLLQNMAPLWIIFFLVLYRMWRSLQQRGTDKPHWTKVQPWRLRSVACGLSYLVLWSWVAFVIAFGFQTASFEAGGFGIRLFSDTVPMVHPHGVMQIEPWNWEKIKPLAAIIRANSGPDDPILICAPVTILYHLTKRRSPTILPLFNLPESFYANPVEEVVADIREKRTKLIVFRDLPAIPIEEYRLENCAPELHRLIMSEYELLEEIQGIQIRILREETVAGF